jgi:hypothetical protein
MTTQQQVEARYPYMFAGKNVGISVPCGWIEIFATLCDEIDALLGDNKHGFHWAQCKEKFGSARWYWDMAGVESALRMDLIAPDGGASLTKPAKSSQPEGVPLVERLSALIRAAEQETSHSCIVCGERGVNDHGNVRGGGWYLTLCPEHANERAAGHLPPIYFEDHGV